MVITDAVTRLIPNVIKPKSLTEESHTSMNNEYPQYTRPEDYNGLKVPDVLLTGNHKEIDKWRKKTKLNVDRVSPHTFKIINNSLFLRWTSNK